VDGAPADSTVQCVPTRPPAVDAGDPHDSAAPAGVAAGDDRPTDDDRHRAAAVLVAVAPHAAARDVPLPSLALWHLAGLAGAGEDAPARLRVAAGLAPARGADAAAAGDAREADGGDDPAGLVGTALEAATDTDRRRTQGLHVTPRGLADDLATRAWAGGPDARRGAATVCDPACGGGAFLVATARRLHRHGIDRRAIARHHLWGADIDPVGLAAAEAALALWAGEPPPPGRLVVGDPLRSGATVWADPPPGGFGAVVGNPPFQGQLGRTTARSDDDRRALRARYGDAVRAYTDTAWLFLLLGCELARPGGRVVLVEPRSVIAARDAAAVRAAVAQLADLQELWLDDTRLFSAAVRVCAPVLARRADDEAAPAGQDRRADGEAAPAGPDLRARPSGADVWRHRWAQASGVPAVDLGGADVVTLGEWATVVAGFRDQYYGLVDAVCEAGEARPGTEPAPLVTSGVLDWGRSRWGDRPVRYAKRRWRAPVVDRDRLADVPPIARRWVERTRAPKLVVASQTPVVEAAVDLEGRWVPSVPALAVVPHVPGELWRLGAAVLSPAATVWLELRTGGTALDRGALKVTGPHLAALPLPTDLAAWDEAAVALRRHVDDPCATTLDRYLDAAARAYAIDTAVTAWWRDRAGTVVHRDLTAG
jgi:hypothetical protein